MISFLERKRGTLAHKILSGFICFTFIFSLIVPPTPVQAQTLSINPINLPAPGTMLMTSSGYVPTHIKGIQLFPNDPLKFNFIIDSGDSALVGQELEDESIKLIKYFLASLTVPEKEMWVNLSPYEQGRIIPDSLSGTDMGRDLLAQDYILKQLTASLMYPEEKTGKKFWDRVYKRAFELYGTTEIPVNTFNKVWIVPDKAVVYETNNTALVAESRLKVMLEEDYAALRQSTSHKDTKPQVKTGDLVTGDIVTAEVSSLSSQIIKEIIIPEIEKEVNEGKNFAQLRQIANSMILAAWYKKNLKESLLGQVYVDKAKLKGIDIENKVEVKEEIYNQYLEAFRKGVYDYIKEDYDPATQDWIPRRYFSGGAEMAYSKALTDTRNFTDLSSEAQSNVRVQRGTLYNETVSLLDVGPRTNDQIIAKVVNDIVTQAKETRTENLAKKKGVIPHREDEPTGFFAVNKAIQTAMTTEGAHEEMDPEYVVGLLSDYWGQSLISQELVRNGVNVNALHRLVSDPELKVIKVKDLKNGSPAIMTRSNQDYQIAHVGVEKKNVYIADGVTQKFIDTNLGFLRVFLTRELVALYKARELVDSGEEYDSAVSQAERFAEKVEKALVNSRLDETVQAQIDNFIDEDYYAKLSNQYVVWDFESSLLRERQGKNIIGGKTYQEAAKWSSRPHKTLRSLGATAKASIDFLKSDSELLAKIQAILMGLDTSDSDARERASVQIREFVLSTPVPEPIAKAIGDAYDALVELTGQERNAVRSSGKAEDVQIRSQELTGVSLGANAGQHDTYLGVVGRDDVVNRWRMDVASLYTDRVLDYRDGIMVLMSFDAILSDANLTAQIISKLSKSDHPDDQLTAKALQTRDIKIISSHKLFHSLERNGFQDAARSVRRAREMYTDINNIGMGVTIMPMADVEISFVLFGHEMSTYWTAMGFQDIPPEEFKDKGRVVTITTNYGIGEAIVQGVTTPDTYLVHMFENNGELQFNVLNKQLGTKTVQTIYTYEARAKLGLEEDQELQDYVAFLETGQAPNGLKGVKATASLPQVKNVLEKLIKVKVDQTESVPLAEDELAMFDFKRNELKLLAHLLKEIRQHDIKIGTMFTDVPKELREQFSAEDSQVVKIAREFYDIADQYHRLVDAEGAVGRNLGEADTAVTVQRRPSNVDADVDSPNEINISYTYVKKSDAKEKKEQNAVIFSQGEDTGLIEGDVLVQGIPTRNALSGKIYRIDESRDLNEQFAEIKDIVEGRKKINENGQVADVAEGEKIAEEDRKLILRTKETTPDYVPVLKLDGVQGVVADVGGATSHAAVVSRELQIATVVGIQSWLEKLERDFGSSRAEAIKKYLNTTGSPVTVDANADEDTSLGVVYAGLLPKNVRKIEIKLDRLPDIYTKIAYIMGMPNPMLMMSKMSQYEGFYGVALMRGEFAYAEENINPRAGRAYDNMVIYNHLRVGPDSRRSRYYHELSTAEQRALDKFRMILKRRKQRREQGVTIELDLAEALIEQFEGKQEEFLKSINKYNRGDIGILRKHSDEIDKLTNQLVGYLSYDQFFESVHGGAVATMAGANNQQKNTVVYRSIDFKKNEARELIGSTVFDPVLESATMIGERGARWLLQHENEIILREELRMLLRQVARGYTNIGFMFPFVATPRELDDLLNILHEEEREMSKALGRPIYLREVGQMTELPSNIRQAEEFIDVLQRHEEGTKKWLAQEFRLDERDIKRSRFLSLGTNDLTQLTMGADRDNSDMNYLFDEAHPFVIESIRHVVHVARQKKIKIGLCGQAIVNLVLSNPEAAEEILMLLGSTGGYAGTDYLGTLPAIVRTASATLKHGVINRTPTQGHVIARNFISDLTRGAAVRPAFTIRGKADFADTYLGDFAILVDDQLFSTAENFGLVFDEDGKLADEDLRTKISQLGAIIYSSDRLGPMIEKLGKDLHVPTVKLTGSEIRALQGKIRGGKRITLDFVRRRIYDIPVDVNVQVRARKSNLEIATSNVEVQTVDFADTVHSNDFYYEMGQHPLAVLEGRGENKFRQDLRHHLLSLIGDKRGQSVLYTTFDLQTDDLVELNKHEAYLKEAEVNPPLGFAGLDALVRGEQWRELLKLELEVIKQLNDEGHNIAVQFNSVKVPESLETALALAEEVGLNRTTTRFGINAMWPGNYLRPSEFIGQGLSFVTIDELKLAQAYLAAHLTKDKNRSTRRFYSVKRVFPHLNHPIRDIRAAADRAGIAVQTIPFRKKTLTPELISQKPFWSKTAISPEQRRNILIPIIQSYAKEPSEVKARTLLDYLEAERERLRAVATGEDEYQEGLEAEEEPFHDRESLIDEDLGDIFSQTQEPGQDLHGDEEILNAIEDTLLEMEASLPSGTIDRIQQEKEDDRAENRDLVSRIQEIGKTGGEEAVQPLFDYIDGALDGSVVMQEAVKALKRVVSRIGEKRYIEIKYAIAKEAERMASIFGLRETELSELDTFTKILGIPVYAERQDQQVTKSFKPWYFPYILRQIRLKLMKLEYAENEVDHFFDLLVELSRFMDLSDGILKELSTDFDNAVSTIRQTAPDVVLTDDDFRTIKKFMDIIIQWESFSASTGNHAVANARIGKILGMKVKVVLSRKVKETKLHDAKVYGAEVVTTWPDGTPIEDYDDARAAAAALFKQNADNAIMVPHSSPMVGGGFSAVTVKLVEKLKALDAIGDPVTTVIPVGEAGLALSAVEVIIALELKNVKVVLAFTENFNSPYLSLIAGYPFNAEIKDEEGYLVEDAVAVPKMADYSLFLLDLLAVQEGSDIALAQVTTEEAEIGTNLVYRDTMPATIEGATGVAAAALLKYPGLTKGAKHAVVFVTGQRVTDEFKERVYRPSGAGLRADLVSVTRGEKAQAALLDEENITDGELSIIRRLSDRELGVQTAFYEEQLERLVVRSGDSEDFRKRATRLRSKYQSLLNEHNSEAHRRRMSRDGQTQIDERFVQIKGNLYTNFPVVSPQNLPDELKYAKLFLLDNNEGAAAARLDEIIQTGRLRVGVDVKRIISAATDGTTYLIATNHRNADGDFVSLLTGSQETAEQFRIWKRKLKAKNREKMELHSSSNITTTVDALYRYGVLDLFKENGQFRSVTMGEILEHLQNHPTSALKTPNDGHLHQAFRGLASLQWLTRQGESASDDMAFTLTDIGQQFLELAPKYSSLVEFNNAIVELMEYGHGMPRDPPAEVVELLQQLAELSNANWNIPSHIDPALASQVKHHLDGLLAMPLMIYFSDKGVFNKFDSNLSLNISPENFGSNELRTFADAGFDILRNAELVEKEGSVVRLRSLGQAAFDTALKHGVTVSYYGLMSLAETLLFGDVSSIEWRYTEDDDKGHKKGQERFVNRRLNIRGSEEAHNLYFDIIGSMFSRMLDEMVDSGEIPFYTEVLDRVVRGGERYLFTLSDTGSGSGAFLEKMDAVLMDSKLGKLIKEYPNLYGRLMIGIDYNLEPLADTKARLDKADIPNIVFRKDISDQSGIARDLEQNLRNLGFKHPDNLQLDVDASTFLVHNRPFKQPKDREAVARRKEQGAQSTGAYSTPDGKAIHNAELEQNLYEFFQNLHQKAKRVLMIELHTLPEDEAPGSLTVAYDRHHEYSNQYPVEKEVVRAEAERAGLGVREKKDFPTVTITTYERAELQQKDLSSETKRYGSMSSDELIAETEALERQLDQLRPRAGETVAEAYDEVEKKLRLVAEVMRRKRLDFGQLEGRDLSSEVNVPIALTQSLTNLGLKSEVVPLVALIMHNRDTGSEGLATLDVRDIVAFAGKSDLARGDLRRHIRVIFDSQRDVIAKLFIDGGQEIENDEGEYIIRVTSLESITNIVTGTANGTSIDFYNKNMEFLGAVRIQWGSAVRAIVTDGKVVQDYVLMGDGKLVEVEKPGDEGSNNIRIPQGKIASLGGESKWRPQFMQELEKDVLSKIGTKGRHADAATADMYKIITEGGIMTRWVNKSEAVSLGKFFEAAGGKAYLLTQQGLVEAASINIPEPLFASTVNQHYFIAGSGNVMDKVVEFAQTKPAAYFKDTYRDTPAPVALPVIYQDVETVTDYIGNELYLSPKLFEVGQDHQREDLTDDLARLYDVFEDTFTSDLDIPTQDAQQQTIVEFLRHEAPEVFFTDDQGQEKIHSLQWMLQNILEPTDPGSAMNASGDVAKKLDKVFNAIFQIAYRPFVHVIVSEESKPDLKTQAELAAKTSTEANKIVYGVGTDASDTKDHRIALLLDPIDGSSMITGGAAFGSIVAFAVLKPGQSIEDGSFNAREQIVFGFKVIYGPSTILTLFNPSTESGEPLIAQHSLAEDGKFYHELDYPTLIDTELDNLEWEGLLPKVNEANPERTTVRLSYGGSTTTASKAHTAFAEWIKDTYGYDSTYTGALINDETENSLAYLSGERRAGVMYTYPLQYKEGKGSGKLRLLFEGLYFAEMRRAMGGALTDGLQPLQNLPFKGDELANIKIGYSSGSSWLTNLEMTWNMYLQKKGIDVNSDEATAQWDSFISEYQKRTRDLIVTLEVMSINKKEQRTQDEIRRALLTWDSTDTGDNHIYNVLFNQSYVEVYDKLFLAADADLSAEGSLPYKASRDDAQRIISSYHGTSTGDEIREFVDFDGAGNHLKVNMSEGNVWLISEEEYEAHSNQFLHGRPVKKKGDKTIDLSSEAISYIMEHGQLELALLYAAEGTERYTEDKLAEMRARHLRLEDELVLLDLRSAFDTYTQDLNELETTDPNYDATLQALKEVEDKILGLQAELLSLGDKGATPVEIPGMTDLSSERWHLKPSSEEFEGLITKLADPKGLSDDQLQRYIDRSRELLGEALSNSNQEPDGYEKGINPILRQLEIDLSAEYTIRGLKADLEELDAQMIQFVEASSVRAEAAEDELAAVVFDRLTLRNFTPTDIIELDRLRIQRKGIVAHIAALGGETDLSSESLEDLLQRKAGVEGLLDDRRKRMRSLRDNFFHLSDQVTYKDHPMYNLYMASYQRLKERLEEIDARIAQLTPAGADLSTEAELHSVDKAIAGWLSEGERRKKSYLVYDEESGLYFWPSDLIELQRMRTKRNRLEEQLVETDLSAEAVSLFEQELAEIQAALENAESLETSQKTTYEDRATRLELLIELENARRTAAAFSELLDTPHPAMAATAERLENKNIEIAALEKKLEELGGKGIEPVLDPIGTDLSAEKPVGGIDLNPELLDMQIKRDGNGVALPLPQQPLHQINIEGFVPVIINVTPIQSLPLLLGMSGEEAPEIPDVPFKISFTSQEPMDRIGRARELEVAAR